VPDAKAACPTRAPGYGFVQRRTPRRDPTEEVTMRAVTLRRASRFVIPVIALAGVLAASQAAGATTEPPTSPPDTEPAGTEPAGTDAATAGSEAPVVSLPDGYVWLVDDTGSITVAVPDTWTDIDTTPQAGSEGQPMPHIAAAPDLAAFREDFDVPGVEFIAAPYIEDQEATIEEFGLERGCAETTVEPYEDPVFTGFVEVGTECGDSGEATWNFIVASPADNSFTALVQVQAATEADLEALQWVLDTFDTAPAGGVPGSTVPGGAVAETIVPMDTAATETTEAP
jgi:hypothetical protein